MTALASAMRRRAWALAGVLVAVWAAAPVAAQTRTLTLDDALRLAAPASEAIGIARAQLVRADGQKQQVVSGWFPQFGGSVVYTRTFQSQFDALLNQPGTGDFPLGQRNAWNLGVQASQALYNFRLPGQVRAANAGVDQARAEVTAQEAQAVLDVTRAYYDAALADRLLAIADSTLAQAERTLADIELGRRVGTQSEFDLLRARVARDNARPLVIERRRGRELAVLRLAQLLNLTDADALVIASPLVDAALSGPTPAMAEPPPPGERTVVRQAEFGVRQSSALLAAARGDGLPSASVTSGYARIGFGSTVFPAWDRFLTDFAVSLRVDVPLFTGGRVGGGVAAARASLDEAELRLRQLREAAAADAADARLALQAAEAQWAATAGTVEQAQRAYAIAELRFREGLSSQTELTESRLQLQQADANRAQAARDLRVARVRVALLRDLPVGGAGIAATAATPGAVAGNQPGTLR